MIRRVVAFVAIAALVVVAAAAPRPPSPVQPDFTEPIQPDTGASDRSSVWYCPWMEAGAETDAVLGMVSLDFVDAAVTLPSPIPNAAPDTGAFELSGPGSANLSIADIVRRGDAPGYVEFSDGPAAATAIVTSEEILAGDQCVASVPKLWHLSGGTTRDGMRLTLRLFNPFPDNAKITVTGVSEFGAVPLPELVGFDVDGRSWRDVELEPIVPFLDELALSISSEEGLVIPAFILSGDGDEASWPGTGLSTSWEFPVASFSGLASSVVLANPGDTDVTVEIDVYTSTGSVEAATTVTVVPSSPTRVPLATILEGDGSIRLRADGPISAAVVAEGLRQTDEPVEPDQGAPVPQIVAGTIGVTTPVTTWLLPGTGSLADSDASIWILNTGVNATTVSLLPLGEEAGQPDKVVVEPGTMQRIDVGPGPELEGYIVDSDQPVTVAWAGQAQRGVVFVEGIAVDE